MIEPARHGVVVVWSGGAPRSAAQRIPEDGLVIDRTLVPWDPAVQPDHARVLVRGPAVEIVRGTGARVSSRRRTATSGEPLIHLRFGDTIAAVVTDIRPFENVTPARIGKLVVAGSLGAIARVLDELANAEEHVSIKGPAVVACELARHYAAKLGSHAWYRPGGDQHLDHFMSTRRSVRTVVIELTRSLFEHDVGAIRYLLETDLRFVVVRPDDHWIGWVPEELQRNTVELPRVRFDELPATILDRATAAVPGARVRTDVIELLLERVATMGEDSWSAALDRAIDRWKASSPRELCTPDLAREFP